ncbi:MAG: DUF5655 domain-containing protein [Ilumatobacter sp.]
MSTPQDQAATQLRNVEAATGRRLADFAAEVESIGTAKHGAIVAYLKAEHGLTHGNANLLAHRIRELIGGGPAAADDLLDAQYAGSKGHLRPIHDRLAEIASGCGPDVERVVQKTGVSFRRRKQFALVQAPSSKRVTLGLNLPDTPDADRITASSGMCRQQVVLMSIDDVDDSIGGWIVASYEAN